MNIKIPMDQESIILRHNSSQKICEFSNEVAVTHQSGEMVKFHTPTHKFPFPSGWKENVPSL